MQGGKRNIIAAIVSRREIVVLLRLVLGVTFIYASYDKILHPYPFTIAVRSYEILPASLSNLFSIMLSWSELIAGSLVLLGLFTRQAAGALFILTGMFIVAIASTLVRGLVIDCGCFGTEGHDPVDLSLLVRDVGLLAAAYLVMRFDAAFYSIASIFSRVKQG